MERLFEIDLKDYKETDEVFRRPSARAIILQENKIALVYSKKEKYYKFPGGGIVEGEDKKEALITYVQVVASPNGMRKMLKVPGLDANTLYSIEGSDEILMGSTLEKVGLVIEPKGGDCRSMLIHLLAK